MDGWRPGASARTLRARAEVFRAIRDFFHARGVIEVDTPLIGRFGVSDPAIEPLFVSAPRDAIAARRFLQTSPEFAMKRLLAAGSGPIYQLGKAFRAAEEGSRHNPEFTMLEWYRPGFDLDQLAAEVADLLGDCLGALGRPLPAVSTAAYAELFEEVLALDPHSAETDCLAAAAAAFTDVSGLVLDRDGWLDLLMSHAVEPALRDRGLVVVKDYPASQAALARCVERDGRRVADRCEVFLGGVELANGYRELLDPQVHRERAAVDNARRRAAGLEERKLDPRLLDALSSGLPDCSGVALGVDRLLMHALGADRLDEVLPFSWGRA
ncbi:MAG: EF-P lysine aminoacylase EpmA [Halieaceae bacterium]|jgi:lysyl-tRNA synthetase class 2|nr:EF-P lysine aminoacylase EpmA [Halieaceae bacterium]